MDDGERRSSLFDADESAMDDMSPDFSTDAQPDVYRDGLLGQALNNAGDTQRRFGGKAQKVNDTGKKSAKDALKKSEEDASKDPNKNGRGGDKNASLGEKEDNVEADTAQGKYKNAVQGIQDIKSGKLKKGSGKLKKAGPAFVILAILFGFGGMSFMSGASLPESFMSQLEGRFDFSGVTTKMRTQNWLKLQTGKGMIKDCRKAPKLFSFHGADSDKTTFKPSKKMTKKLAAQGIEFEDVDGMKVMKYKGKTIVANPEDAVDGRYYFEDLFNTDPDFQVAYTNGARTWRGSVSKWFDSRIEGFLDKIGVSRNVWREFKNSKARAEGNMAAMRQTMADYADSDTAEGRMVRTDTEIEETTEEVDGKEVTTKTSKSKKGEAYDASLKRADVELDNDGKIKSMRGLESSLTDIGNNTESLKKISNMAGTITNLYCGIADFVSAVSAIVAAYQAVQIIKTSSAIFEAFQKAKAGEADATPINEIARSMMEPTTATYTQTMMTNEFGKADRDNRKTVERTRSATQAEGFYALYRGEAVDGDDVAVQSYNINSVIKPAYQSLGLLNGAATVSATGFASCTAARLATAAIDAAQDVAEVTLTVIGCVGAGAVSFGAALVGCIAGAIGKAMALQALVGITISAMVSFMVPFVATALTRKIATEVMGEDLGNALVNGGNKIYGGQYQYSGGSVATKETLPQYFQLQAFEKEEIARYERATRSPFDITSEYTFLGSLATKMIPLASSMHDVSSFVKGVGDIFSSSLSSLTPRSSAISAGIRTAQEAEITEKYCPDVYEIGGIADAFCDPYFISDLSTIGDHPADIVDNISEYNIKEVDGIPEIQENSDLAKYIIFCGQRSSPWGKADQNIMAQVAPPNMDEKAGTTVSTETSYGSSITIQPLSGIANALPVIGDALDIVDAETKIANMGWITGASCVTGYEKSAKELNTIGWEEEKKFQRFMEDQALAEAEGLGESAVSKFLTKYYEKHPLDNSFEGILARYSGLTKENVIATLDTLDALTYIADYDPSDYYPYLVEEEEHIISLTDGDDYDLYRAEAALSQNYSIVFRKEAYIS